MGDPIKPKKFYSRPKKPWEKSRLDAERILVKEYGIVNKKEIYRMRAFLKKFTLQAKNLMSSTSLQAENDRKTLIKKLHSLSLVNQNAQLDDILALELKNILERRLQTLVLRKGLASTMRQARQMIVHQHIKVGGKSITSPSYIVSKEEEAKLAFLEKSPFVDPEHPERPETIFKIKEANKKKEEPKAEVKVEEKKPEVKAEEKTEEKKEPEVAK